MKKHYLLHKPTPLRNLLWEDFYEDMFSDWRIKAERLQLRRWRKLKHQQM